MSGRIVGMDGRPIDRNKASAPMTPFTRIANNEEMVKTGVMAAFENNKYMVLLRTTVTNGFMVPDEKGEVRPMEVAHLTIIRASKAQKEISWSDKQKIKNEILGDQFEAVEIFPAEDRRLKEIPGYHCYIWAFEGGARLPLGLEPERPGLDDPSLEISKEETEVYVIETPRPEPNAPPITEVFVSEEEARTMYEASGNEFAEGSVRVLNEIPVGGDGVAWTGLAREKLDLVMAKVEKIQAIMDGKAPEPGPIDASSEVRRINVNGPVTDQDELEDAYKVGEEAPRGDEENVMMPEYMEMGIKQIERSREDDAKDQSDS